MRLVCPACSTRIPPASINVESLVAACPSCGEVFPFGGMVPPPVQTRARVPRPKSITLGGNTSSVPGEEGYREGTSRFGQGTLTLTRSWFNFVHVFLLLFSFVWDAVIVGWYTLAFSRPLDMVTLVFPLIHVGVGVFITYTALAGLFNRTTITVGEGSLKVHHGPLPWPGSHTLATSDVKQLFVRKTVHQNKGTLTASYAVAADVDGTLIDLLKGLSSIDEARFIEQTIESHLAIVDNPDADQL